MLGNSSQPNDDRHQSVPPEPKPRASHLASLEEISDENSKSPAPALSQSRVRRLRQRGVATNDEPPKSPPLRPPPVVVTVDDEEKPTKLINNAFIAKIRENDTLARFKRLSSTPGDGQSIDGKTHFI